MSLQTHRESIVTIRTSAKYSRNVRVLYVPVGSGVTPPGVLEDRRKYGGSFIIGGHNLGYDRTDTVTSSEGMTLNTTRVS